ncbi:alpha-galactosidase [Flavisolibacter ginsenosidimutans]|uniref:Alpha-galactosidase n=1 Tax=Flavisolibacter ginsenosidimutans TaxID=661481 RepID=A0A5B8UCK3_9BACT|nr:alpha-galactosidase [Flavisolibacter ginsenosidimutans]QEC54397.1 alpha-galactosidase [Flavisolibacter ginsenosidimutans]
MDHSFLKRGRHCFILLLFSFNAAFAQNTTAIQSVPDPNGGWIIRTKSSAYQLLLSSDKRLYPVFYGPLAQAVHQKRTTLWTQRIEEIPVRGGYPTKTPTLEVIFNDNVRDADLEYVSGEVVNIDNRSTLKIIERDRLYPLQVTSYIRVLPEFDVLEKWMEIKNTGKKGNIKLQNALSGSIFLPPDEYVLSQLSGMELSEFNQYNSTLSPGLKIIENRMFKSNNNMPWFLVRPKSSANDLQGPAWFGSVHYSGNWRLIFDNTYDRSYASTLQITGGINFWDTEWTLKPGETFETPKFSVGYTSGGAEGAAQSNAAYVRKSILRQNHRDEMRPILFNSWYATTYHLKEDEQIAMAKIAAGLGVELFAIDDGWFKNREKGDEGLGDWVVDQKKFPNGLQPMIDSVHRLGMKFGIWVEPESVVLKTDLYKEHPDWILEFPRRRKTPGRVFLNLAREDVFSYLYSSLDRLLRENKIDFVKWDQNSVISDPGWADASPDMQKEVRIRFIKNLYRLVDTLTKKYPEVLFESCASGGGRVDLGMMSRMDQAWTSDNSTAVDRLFIQYGYLGALPANTMVSWVIESIANQVQISPSLSYKFDVAMSGVLGIGYDIRKWNAEQTALAKKKITLYKQIRPLVQQGIVSRLVSPFEHNRCSLQYTSENSDSAVLFCYNLAIYESGGYNKAAYLTGAQFADKGSTTLKLRGLDSSKQYRIRKAGDEADKGAAYSGDYLMNIGMEWPVKNSFESAVFLLNAER